MNGILKALRRKGKAMEDGIGTALSGFPPKLVKTITCDQDPEFANWRRIEKRPVP
ncbi:MAG TPA: hypothetical protein IAD42_04105 [Candidatus Scatomorpha pullistercoris]|uniref:Uncharacterized protein n=1 Tax=Candidatus Scatomorpha pullistercoris TaxID=2840929 RepID=A0A9D1K7S0_9FIRM|nr:hypothetical protein [Candidatus Scatomorpha pullistercoris]